MKEKKLDAYLNYSELDVVFFDAPIIQFRRFSEKIAKILKDEQPSIRIGAIILDTSPKSDPIRTDDFPKEWDSIFDQCLPFNRIKDFDVFLRKAKPKLLFLCANRIPDDEIVLHAKKLGIRTVLFQHGLFYKGCCINEMSVHNVFLASRRIDKVLNYLSILRRMCKYDNTSFLRILFKIVFEKGDLQAIAIKNFSIPLLCDKAYIIGEKWKDYYISNFGYSPSDFVVVGSHDLDDFEIGNKVEQAYCYIANTLVEEGTIRRKTFLRFIKTLSDSIDDNAKLYVKLHPMSDISLYGELRKHNVIFLKEQGELPPVTVYIAHHSTLIGKALYHSDQLIIWKFKSEKVCFYKDYAFRVCQTKDELVSALSEVNLQNCQNEKRKDISKLYMKNEIGAFRSCVLDVICNELRCANENSDHLS